MILFTILQRLMIGYIAMKLSERNVETSSTSAEYCPIRQLTSFSV